MYIVKPELRRTTILATFTTPISHHDPEKAGNANVTNFLRRKQIVERRITKAPSSEDVQRIISTFPVPEALAALFDELTVPEFLSAAVTYQFLRLYNGQGLMDGKERYARLQSRVEFNAMRSATLFAWWGGMVKDMMGMSPYETDKQIGVLLTMPSALAQLVFVEMIDNAASAVMLARLWNEAAWSEGEETRHVTLTLKNVNFSTSNKVALQVPAYSANSARHEIVREPGAIHMLNALGLRFDEIHDGAAQMLYNGGDLNTSAPSNAFALTREVRATYPLLGLIGGSTAGFILGESNLTVSAWLNVTENAAALEQFGVVPEMSAFDLLDRDTQTKHTNKRVEGSPMPYSFETLVAGTQLIVDLRLRPYATDLEIGALAAAVETFFGADSTLGGQSARGFGLMAHEMLVQPDQDMIALREQYEAYLLENKAQLRDGLINGTLTTSKSLFGK